MNLFAVLDPGLEPGVSFEGSGMSATTHVVSDSNSGMALAIYGEVHAGHVQLCGGGQRGLQ